MATAYTSLLGLALPVTGELSGTWGDTVNTAITGLLDTAVAGTTSITVDADTTLTTTTGAANTSRQAIILWNPAAGTTTRNITAPAQSKMYTVINASGGTQSIVLRGAGPTTGVTILKGESAIVAWNGSDFIKVSNTSGAGVFTSLTVSGTTTLSGLTASTALALDASKNIVSVTNTGTGSNVLSASPTLTGTVAGASLSLSSLTSGRVTYAGASGLLQDSANLTFNGTTLTANTIGAFTLSGTVAGGGNQLNNVIIGTTTPLAGAFTTLTTTGDLSAVNTIIATNSAALYGNSNNFALFRNSSSAVVGGITHPAVTTLGLWGNTGVKIFNGASAATTIADFSSTGLAVTGTLSATGDVIGGNGSTQARLVANSSAAQFSDVLFQTAGVARWAIEKSGAEGGSNAGGDLFFYRYSDAGVYLGNPLTITRSTGLVTANTSLAVTGTLSSTLGATIQGLTVGLGAGAVSTNTAVGASALAANTTGSNNTAVGYQAGYSNTTGATNAFFGYQAGYNNIAGVGNTFIGMQAGSSHNTAGNTFNTFVGYYSGYSTTGTLNTFLGEESGQTITSGSKNTIVGRYNGNQGGLDIRTASNYIVLSDGDGNPRGIFDGSGNLLVGTTSNPSGYRLKVNGLTQVEGANTVLNSGQLSSTATYIQSLTTSAAAADLVFFNTSERARIDASGNLGIGTSSPAQKLDVVGSIKLTGSVIPATAGQGIDFTANTGAAGMTSELLNWYEEGTWTPSVTAQSGAYTTVTTQSGTYTRVGRQVTIRGSFNVTVKGTGGGGALVAGLPFTPANNIFVGVGVDRSTFVQQVVVVYFNSGNVYINTTAGGDGIVATNVQDFTATYFV